MTFVVIVAALGSIVGGLVGAWLAGRVLYG
jgi:hypothetical protein